MKCSSPAMPLEKGDLDPITVGATGLTNACTESSFLQSSKLQRQSRRSSQYVIGSRQRTRDKPSYTILIAEARLSSVSVLTT